MYFEPGISGKKVQEMYYKIDSVLNPIQVIVDPSLIKQGTTMYLEPLQFSATNPWLTYTSPTSETIPNAIMIECDEVINCLLANGTGTSYFWNIQPVTTFYSNAMYTSYDKIVQVEERYKLASNLGVLNLRFLDQDSQLLVNFIDNINGTPVLPKPSQYSFSFRISVCLNS